MNRLSFGEKEGHLAQVDLEFQVLETLLHKGDQSSWRDLVLRDALLVHKGLIAKHEGRMVEACSASEVYNGSYSRFSSLHSVEAVLVYHWPALWSLC